MQDLLLVTHAAKVEIKKELRVEAPFVLVLGVCN